MNRKLVFCIFLLMIPLLVFSVSGEVFVINSSDVRQSATIDGSFEYSYKVNYNINEGEEIYFALDRSENIILGLKYMGETETGAFIFEVHSVSNSIVRKSKRFIQQSRWAGARPFDLVRIDFADVKISVNKRLLTGNINIDTLELKRTESKGIDNFLLSTNIAKKTFSEYFETIPKIKEAEILPGENFVKYLRILNRNSIAGVINTATMEDRELVEAAQSVTSDNKGISSKVNYFEWVYPSDTTSRVIIFPAVNFNDTDYDNLKISIKKGSWFGISVIARVFLGHRQVDCSQGSATVTNFFTQGIGEGMSLSFGNTGNCGPEVIGGNRIASLNLDRIGGGQHKLKINSPLIPDGDCKIDRSNVSNDRTIIFYNVSCS